MGKRRIKVLFISEEANDLLKKSASYNGVKQSYIVNTAIMNLLKKD